MVKNWIKVSIIVSLILIIGGVIAFQAISTSFSGRAKFDFGAGGTNASSANFIQRFILGIQPVSKYSSNNYSGRFGILEENVYAVNTTACGALNVQNAVYVLNQSVNSSGTCFNITANNVSLDCSGYTINYTQISTGYGITANGYNNSKIQNCTIVQGRTNAASSYGIYLLNGNESAVERNNISTSGSTSSDARNYAVYLYNYKDSVVYNNNLTTSGRRDYAIVLDSNSNSTNISSNIIKTSAIYSFGVYDYKSSFNVLKENNISTGGTLAYGIYLSLAGSNNLTSNNISTTGASGYAVYLEGGAVVDDSNRINSNHIYTSGANSKSIYLYKGVLNTNIINNNITANGSRSYGIDASSTNNSVINSNIINVSGTNSNGVRLVYYSDNNNFTNNNITATSAGSTGFYLLNYVDSNILINNSVEAAGYSLLMGSGTSNKIYNNKFNSTSRNIVSITRNSNYVNELNTTKTDISPQKNIIGGNYLAGNYWANSLGTGFSQKCKDTNLDGICDNTYTINTFNVDYLPLTASDNTAPIVSLFSPENGTFVNGRVDLIANASDNDVVANVVFQYSNSSVSFTNIANCNLTATNYYGNYRCSWYTTSFSNDTGGYDINVSAYDGQGNIASDIKHYTIDRTRPIIYDMDVGYPSGQSSVRNTQNITLKAVVTDSPDIAAGIYSVEANLTYLNSTNWVNMTFFSGSKKSDMNSTWHLNVSVSSTTGNKLARIRVYDAATPTHNTAGGRFWNVVIDNDIPTYTGLNSTDGIYNNTQGTFIITANDNYDLDHYIFSNNWSGSWINDSSVSISGTSEYIESKKVIYTGNFSYKFFIFDDAGNMNETAIGNIEVLGSAPVPTIYLVSPNDTTLTNSNSATLQYYYINGDLNNCSLILDGIDNQTTTSPANYTTLSFSKTLADGIHPWYVLCRVVEEEDGNNITREYYSEETYSLTIDTIAPTITIESPTNTTHFNKTAIEFNASINEDTSWCGFSLNSAANTTMTIANSTYFRYSNTGMSAIGYGILFTCNDTANNYGTKQQNFSLDFVDVSVNVTSPLNRSEVIRGSDSVANEDDLGLVANTFNIIGKVYEDASGNGLIGATCYFYFNGTYLGESYSNETGDCNLSYDKTAYSASSYNVSINHTYLVTERTQIINNSDVNISLVRYVTPNSVAGKGGALTYSDGTTAILYFNVTKINESGTTFYGAQNVSANASTSAGNYYSESAYVSGYRLSNTTGGQYEVRVVVNKTFGSYIKWNIWSSADNYINYIGTALHADVEITTTACGNGVLETGEGCDDGNLVSGDGCSASCESGGGTGGGPGPGPSPPTPPTCKDECSSGDKETTCVTSSTLRTRSCGNYDEDSCSEYGDSTYTDCTPGKICQSAQCMEIDCNDYWQCDSWNECKDGTQARTCANTKCEMDNKIESRGCEICSENWKCEWTICEEGEQDSSVYGCVDLNACETTENKPDKKSCGELIDEECPNAKWKCSDISECQADYSFEDVLKGVTHVSGFKERACTDTTGCAENKTEKKDCNLAVPIEAIKTEWCEEDYVEIFESETNKLVSRVKESETTQFSELNRIDISFITTEFTGYCGYCFDGIKNYDETNIDCGGPNCPECIERVKFFDWLWIVILVLWSTFGFFLFFVLKRRKEEKEAIKRPSKIKRLIEMLKPMSALKARKKEERIESWFKGLFRIRKRVERAEIRERVVERKTWTERKAKRKERKRKINTLKREVRKRKLLGLMRKLKIWKKEGYYGTAHLEEEIRRLKNQKD